MALLTKQHLSDAGTNPSFTAVTASDTYEPDDRTWLHVKNGGASPSTVTIVTPKTVSGKAVGDAGGSVPAGGERLFGPLPSRLFGDPDNGDVGTVTCSPTTSVTIGCFEI